MNCRRFFKEAYKAGYIKAKKRLNETSIDAFRKKNFKKTGWDTNLGIRHLKNTNRLAQMLQQFENNDLLDSPDAYKKGHLANYAKQYSRFLALMEYISSIYDSPENMTKEEAQEVYKTAKAALKDLYEVRKIVEDGRTASQHTRWAEVRQGSWDQKNLNEHLIDEIDAAIMYVEQIYNNGKFRQLQKVQHDYDSKITSRINKNAYQKYLKNSGKRKIQKFEDAEASLQKYSPEGTRKIVGPYVITKHPDTGKIVKTPIKDYYNLY